MKLPAEDTPARWFVEAAALSLVAVPMVGYFSDWNWVAMAVAVPFSVLFFWLRFGWRSTYRDD